MKKKKKKSKIKKNKISLYKITGMTGIAVIIIFAVYAFIPVNKALIKNDSSVSLRITDRNNVLLTEIFSKEEGTSLWKEKKDISPYVFSALLSAEDERFYKHHGVDLYAVLRAFVSNTRRFRVISGASTISQQMARMIYKIPRKAVYKPLVMYLAVKLENSLSKDELLVNFINRVPFGNQTFGIGAAAKIYFNKEPSMLSAAEAAFLVGCLKSATYYDPYRLFRKAKERQEYVLKRMLKAGYLNNEKYDFALTEKIQTVPYVRNFKAPHFCYYVMEEVKKMYPGKKYSEIKTTLDYYKNISVQESIRGSLFRLKTKNVTNGAAVVLDADGSIVCMVGSGDFFDAATDGQVNGTISIRQPGSTLKPFTYAVAFENGFTPADIIPDVSFKDLSDDVNLMVKNYDGRFHGPVRIRTALACSYNIPAVRILKKIGEDRLLSKLKEAGFESLKLSSDYYKLGLTLGDGDVTLLELTRAYSIFQNGGIFKDVRAILALKDRDGKVIDVLDERRLKRVFSPGASWLITDILSDNVARKPSFGENSLISFPFPCAVKTGTSNSFRDNWAIGFTPEYVFGVWAGNFNASSMKEISGVDGAGPAFRDIVLKITGAKERRTFKSFEIPKNVISLPVCPVSGKIRAATCPNEMMEWFMVENIPRQSCEVHRSSGVKEVYSQEYREWAKENMIEQPENMPSAPGGKAELKISFPCDGDIFSIDPKISAAQQQIKFKALVPEEVKKINWQVDGKDYSSVSAPFYVWWKLEPGEHKIKITAELPGKKLLASRELTFRVY